MRADRRARRVRGAFREPPSARAAGGGTSRRKRSSSTSDARRLDGSAFEGDVALVGARRRIERIVSIARSREESVTRRGARED